MKGLMSKFRERYKSTASHNSLSSEENFKKEAAELTKLLAATINMISMLKPHNNDWNVVQLTQNQLDIIVSVLNTNNALILENKNFLELRPFLEELVANNETGIKLGENINKNARIAKTLAASLQPKEYWEDVPSFLDR